jgi:hypothetical protein
LKPKHPNHSNSRGKVKADSPIDEITITNYQYPIFCFKHLHKDFNFDICTNEEKCEFLNQISMLSKLTWQEIQTSHKHGLGSEKINIDSIIPSTPGFITPDVKHLLALRFSGKKPFLGIRNRFILHVIYVDPKMEVYNH